MFMEKSLCALVLLAPFAMAQAGTQKVSLKFEAMVGNQPFACGKSYADVGVTHSGITPSDMRFYVSQVELLDARGKPTPLKLEQDGVWQYRDVALLDFEDGSGPCRNGNPGLHTAITGSAPKGRYVGVRFTLGVPFDLNHGDPTIAPSPLNSSAMFWAWQSGYKFVKIDMASSGQQQEDMQADGSMQDKVAMMAKIDQMKKQGGAPAKRPPRAAGFSVHLGSTACVSPSLTTAPSECRNPNRMTVTFDRFDPKKNVVVADLGSLLRKVNVDVNAPDSAPGCMSAPNDADCPSVMSAFGLPFGEQSAGEQRFFRLR